MQLDPWPFPPYGRSTPKPLGCDLAAARPVIDERVVRSPGPWLRLAHYMGLSLMPSPGEHHVHRRGLGLCYRKNVRLAFV